MRTVIKYRSYRRHRQKSGMRGVLTTSETKIIKPDTMKKECFEHKRNLSEGEKESPLKKNK